MPREDLRAPRGDDEGPLSGLGRFSAMVFGATVVGTAVAAVCLWVYAPAAGDRVSDATRAVVAPPPRRVAAAPPDAIATPAPRAAGDAASAGGAPLSSAAEEAASVAREVERRRAAGSLQEAVKRFAACPGGDVRRAAAIDGDRVVRLEHERADGIVVEEWFDAAGRLREARVRRPAAPASATRRILFDAQGATLLDTARGDGPPPLDRDPARAFFATAGCTK
jgi:hypothetical protein